LDILKLRENIPALQNYVWFQNGGVSVTPREIASVHAALMQELFERGPMHIIYPNEEYPRRTNTMRRLAAFFGVSADELSLMRGVSEGYQTILRGLDWREGDQVMITTEEEQSLYIATLHLRDVRGVEVIKLPLIDDPAAQLQAAAERLTERTRLIAISHVTTDLGFRLPIRAICDLARSRGVLTFVDMAHAAGLFPTDLRELGMDFAGILSYKWMYAPYAAGLLYLRRERLDDIRVMYAGGRAEAWFDNAADTFALKETAERFQYGPWSWPLVHAWAAAADYLCDIGLENIWARTAALTTRLKTGLAQIPGVVIHTPAAPEASAALVSFSVAGWDGDDLSGALRARWNIMIKALYLSANGLRASVPFFLLDAEIDLLVDAIAILAAERNTA
jgi:selenocysteine lyase/cysteine desulfurase